MRDHIIFHAFLWQVKDIINELDKIKYQGFTAIQITPVQKIKNGNEWWNVYQNLGFDIGNKYGTKEDIKLLCEKANEINLKIIIDVILDHCANEGGGNLCLIPHHDIPKCLTNNSKFWKEKKIITNWDDRYQVINYCANLPTYDLSNIELQDIIIKFMNELINIGCGGFRIDSGKAISLPEENENTFWIRVFNNLHNKDKLFNYAELIFCDKNLLDKYSKYINVLSNCYCSNKSKLVTFFISHDSDLEFGYTKQMTDEMILNEWEILLKNNSESSVLFYCRPYSNLWKSDKIREINTKLK